VSVLAAIAVTACMDGCSGVPLTPSTGDDGGGDDAGDGGNAGDVRAWTGTGTAADSGLDRDARAVASADGASDGGIPDDARVATGADATPDGGNASDAPADEGNAAATDGESSNDAPTDVAMSDTNSGDATSPCASPTPVACVNPMTGANDFCSGGGACNACVDITDDSSCAAAYGSGVCGLAGCVPPADSYLCLAGTCSPGDCRTDGDCAANANGPLCGVSTPNFCGKCGTDGQCADAFPTSPVCDIAAGQCVAGTCTPHADNPPAVCPANPSDICCSSVCQSAGGTNACCPGPNANTYCAGLLGTSYATCSHNVCTTCPLATGANYQVDPANGSDLSGTGDDTTPGCAFKTITRALEVIGTPLFATRITVLGPSSVNDGEAFPIELPGLVSVTTSAGAVTVSVPAGTPGFSLAAPSSGLSGGPSAPLTISGQSNTATYGIVATTGSQPTTQVANLIVTGFLDDGILVEKGGILSIGPGVTSTLNGIASARKAGLHVKGTGEAIVNVPVASAPTHFDQNTNHGIFVEENGFIELTGAVTSATSGTGTITTNGNYAAGIWIAQTPGAPPQNIIRGVVSFGATNGNGMHFVTGSNVRVRDSVSLGNQASGILVSSTAANSDISAIDLGNPTGPDFGNNTLQEPLGAANNGNAGICLDVRANAGILLGAGNIFGNSDCATNDSPLAFNRSGCGNSACSGVCDIGVTGANTDVNVSKCSHP
jgi:hypothetical protein